MYSQYGINPFTTKIKLKTINILLRDAYEKDMEDRLWQQWLVDYSRMGKEIEFISFTDYKSKTFKTKNNEKIDVKKIIEDAEKIKALHQKGGKP